MAGIENKGPMTRVKRRQMILLVALVVLVSGIALLAGILGTPKKKASPTIAANATRKAFGVNGEQVNSADFWRTEEGARVSTLEAELREMKLKLQANEKRAETEKNNAEAAAQAKDKEDKRIEEEKKSREASAASRQPPPRTDLTPQGDLGSPGGALTESAPMIKSIVRVEMVTAADSPAGKATKTAQSGTTSAVAAKGSGGDSAGSTDTAETYIPSGSFMRGVLLSGLDAPTGGQAQQNPHPILIEVVDMASLPNKFKADYKNCRLIANGVGDLSSERAFIRLDRMSCITEDGGAIDLSVKGFIADTSGKAGIRGRLVSKQGSVLANALVSGVASGIGNAFSQGAMTTSTSPLGSTSTVKEGTQYQLQAGIGTGIGTALNELSKYYISLAEKMFPIIEVDAGQPVDIVITKGFSVARR